MRHLRKKLRLAGGGKRSRRAQPPQPPQVVVQRETKVVYAKPKPAVYRPPTLGNMVFGTSYSFAETVDLLSDGPIAGLVNGQGVVTDSQNILQGVYLDDVPVAITDSKIIRGVAKEAQIEKLGSLSGSNVSDFTNFFKNIQTGVNSLLLTGRAANTNTPLFEGSPLYYQENFSTDLPAGETDIFSPVSEAYYNVLDTGSNTFLIGWGGRENEGSTQKTNPANPFRFPGLAQLQLAGGDYGEYVGNNIDNLRWVNAHTGQNISSDVDTRTNDWTGAWTGSNVLLGVNSDDILGAARNQEQYAQRPPSPSAMDYVGFCGVGKRFPKVPLFNNPSEGSVEGDPMGLFGIQSLAEDNGFETALGYSSIIAGRALSQMNSNWEDYTTDGDNGESPLQQMFGEFLQNQLKDMGFYCIFKPDSFQSDLSDKAMTAFPVSEKPDGIRFAGSPLLKASFKFKNAKGENVSAKLADLHGVKIFDFLTPVVQRLDGANQEGNIGDLVLRKDGFLTGELRGFMLLVFPKESLITKEYWDGASKEWSENTPPIRLSRAIHGINAEILDLLTSISSVDYTVDDVPPTQNGISPNQWGFDTLKYNYSNILAEFRDGKENQAPLKHFNRVFIDVPYNQKLFGAFRANGDVQRIAVTRYMLAGNGRTLFGPDGGNHQYEYPYHRNGPRFWGRGDPTGPPQPLALPLNEGSQDRRYAGRGSRNQLLYKRFDTWAGGFFGNDKWDEDAVPAIHVVTNPNVNQVFITLNVSNLSDHIARSTSASMWDGTPGGATKVFSIGKAYPAPINFLIETGEITEDGTKEVYARHYFRMIALVESPVLIDIGNPDGGINPEHLDRPMGPMQHIAYLNVGQKKQGFGRGNTNVPIKLPPIYTEQDCIDNDEIKEGTLRKRYVRVEKLSTETNSVLINKAISLDKVTEIIDTKLNYPLSSIIGTKLDSRTFGQLPQRSYDAKLKLVRVPSNYFPVDSNGMDKRYYSQIKASNDPDSTSYNPNAFDNTPRKKKQVYVGDWDGTFASELKWTDNPAWILYDLLTNKRYGLGNQVAEEDINKWELYKIGRFCDAVDSEGYFEGVPDGHGGLEPRYSCNIVFSKGEKVYDAVNLIANLFRGKVFYGNSELNFADDRPRSPVALFTNETVRDGLFSYSNNRRDQQYNTIEISYKDRFEAFEPKIEVIEDEEDVRQRGVFKTRIAGVGVTSRSMARRIAQHYVFESIQENQNVAFNAGLESLLCRPGDLIIIEDDLKTNKSNIARVLDVDEQAYTHGTGTIRLSTQFDASDYTGQLTVFTPTGRDDFFATQKRAQKRRQRVESFHITGLLFNGAPKNFDQMYTGLYKFGGYTGGYVDATGFADPKFQQYAYYTGTLAHPASGTGLNVLHFAPEYTGWVFSSGGKNKIANTGTWDFISSGTGTHTLYELSRTGVNTFSGLGVPWRDPAGPTYEMFSGTTGVFSGTMHGATRGFSESDFSITAPTQTTVLNFSGVRNEDYGCTVTGIDNYSLLPFIKLGSPVKFKIKDASDFIYKVVSVAEQAPNEYTVSATKYDTGKYKLIDSDISILPETNTFAYQVSQVVDGRTFETLKAPTLTGIITGEGSIDDTFFVKAGWTDTLNGSPTTATGYNCRLQLSNGVTRTVNVPTSNTTVTMDNLNTIGHVGLSVNCLGNRGANPNEAAYFDSSYDSTGFFVLFEQITTFDKMFVNFVGIR